MKRAAPQSRIELVVHPSDALADAVRLHPDGKRLGGEGLVHFAPLEVADAVVRDAASGEVLAYIERKTLADLAASRVDKRWDSQKSRMLLQREDQLSRGLARIDIVYAIEADASDLYGRGVSASKRIGSCTVATLRAMLRNVQRRPAEACRVVFCGRTPHDTAAYVIDRLYYEHATFAALPAAQKRSRVLHADADGSGDSRAYAILSTRKQKNLTPKRAFVRNLAEFPGVGIIRARTIQTAHRTRQHLLNALYAGGERALVPLAGIGPRVSQTVYRFVCMSADDDDDDDE